VTEPAQNPKGGNAMSRHGNRRKKQSFTVQDFTAFVMALDTLVKFLMDIRPFIEGHYPHFFN